MKRIDVFNGDADGLCARQQLWLAEQATITEPSAIQIVTGAKRDIGLVARVEAAAGDLVTVLDLGFDRNRDAVLRLLERGVRVRYFDHHESAGLPAHPLLEARTDTSAGTCTSAIVDAMLGGRFRIWAVVGAFGDNLIRTAHRLAVPLVLEKRQLNALRDLGQSLNYNAYAETDAGLIAPPATLAREMQWVADPLRYADESETVARIAILRRIDLETARAVAPRHVSEQATAHLLPDADASRRVMGSFANELATDDPHRTHAVLARHAGALMVSVRAPSGAAALCRRFGGGGRAEAGGIDALPEERLEEFIAALDGNA